jgi:cell division protein FtsL
MNKKNNSRQIRKSPRFWFLICIVALFVAVTVLFVQMRKLESKSLNERISTVKTDLDDVKSTLNDIKNDSTLSIKINKIDRRINELESKVKSLPKDSNGNFPNCELWLALGLTWMVFIVLVFIFRKKISQPTESDREKIITTVLESQRITGKFISSERYETQRIYSVENKIANLEKQINDLQNNENNDSGKTDTQTKTDDARFFKSNNGKILTDELPNATDAFFKVYNINGNEVKFEYCGSVVNPDVLTDVCCFANNPFDVPNKTKIITIESGIVKKNNNNWEVIKIAKIKFE